MAAIDQVDIRRHGVLWLAMLTLAIAGMAYIRAALGTGLATPSERHESELARRLGQNPFATSVRIVDVEPIRNFIGATEVFDRIFSDQSCRFELYVACWEPGMAQLRHAYGHIPDVCWVNTGWRCDAGESRRLYQFGQLKLRPAEWRRFSFEGQSQEVIYWCIIGDRLFPFQYDGEAVAKREEAIAVERRKERTRAQPAPGLFEESVFLDYWRRRVGRQGKAADEEPGMAVTKKTYFIRINSSVPFTRLAENRMFVEQIGKLAELGIVARDGDME